MEFVKRPVKGMCDILPDNMRLREYVLNMIKESYARYGFSQIETPAMEHIENLCSKQGGDNEKLIFKVLKRGKSLSTAIENNKMDALADSGLRYDLTVPLARYYANNCDKLPVPFKSLQIGNVWRADNPQKGRFRQFVQCDIDILGDDSALAEIELITATAEMLVSIFRNVDVSGLTVHINDRRILRAVCIQAGFNEEDIDSVFISLDKLDKIGVDGVKSELLSNGYEKDIVDRYMGFYANKSVKCETFCEKISQEYLSQDVVSNLNDIVDAVTTLSSKEIKIIFDPALVRGMGYYTGPIFEISIDGYNFSIAGGGRYDKMIGKFSGTSVCACGFSIGFERIITILHDHIVSGHCGDIQKTAFLVHKDVPLKKRIAVFQEAQKIRELGQIVSILLMKKNLNSQLNKVKEDGYTDIRKIYSDN